MPMITIKDVDRLYDHLEATPLNNREDYMELMTVLSYLLQTVLSVVYCVTLRRIEPGYGLKAIAELDKKINRMTRGVKKCAVKITTEQLKPGSETIH